jgi:hypothetical protein
MGEEKLFAISNIQKTPAIWQSCYLKPGIYLYESNECYGLYEIYLCIRFGITDIISLSCKRCKVNNARVSQDCVHVLQIVTRST